MSTNSSNSSSSSSSLLRCARDYALEYLDDLWYDERRARLYPAGEPHRVAAASSTTTSSSSSSSSSRTRDNTVISMGLLPGTGGTTKDIFETLHNEESEESNPGDGNVHSPNEDDDPHSNSTSHTRPWAQTSPCFESNTFLGIWIGYVLVQILLIVFGLWLGLFVFLTPAVLAFFTYQDKGKQQIDLFYCVVHWSMCLFFTFNTMPILLVPIFWMLAGLLLWKGPRPSVPAHLPNCLVWVLLGCVVVSMMAVYVDLLVNLTKHGSLLVACWAVASWCAVLAPFCVVNSSTAIGPRSRGHWIRLCLLFSFPFFPFAPILGVVVLAMCQVFEEFCLFLAAPAAVGGADTVSGDEEQDDYGDWPL